MPTVRIVPGHLDEVITDPDFAILKILDLAPLTQKLLVQDPGSQVTQAVGAVDLYIRPPEVASDQFSIATCPGYRLHPQPHGGVRADPRSRVYCSTRLR